MNEKEKLAYRSKRIGTGTYGRGREARSNPHEQNKLSTREYLQMLDKLLRTK